MSYPDGLTPVQTADLVWVRGVVFGQPGRLDMPATIERCEQCLAEAYALHPSRDARWRRIVRQRLDYIFAWKSEKYPGG